MARKNLKVPSGVNEELYRYYRTLADKADKRMERLEKLAQSNEIYHGVTAYAYRKAVEDISYWDNEKHYEKARFARNHPTTEKEIKAKIKDIEAFLELPTSTKSGIDKTYKKRAETLNIEFGTNFTWQEWARFGARDYWSGKDGIGYRELIAVASKEKAKEEVEKKIKAIAKSFKPKKSSGTKLGRKIKRNVRKDFQDLVKNIDDFDGKLLDEIDYKDLLSKDIDIIKKSVNTVFEDNEGIVMKQTRKYMALNNLTYRDMFT